MFGANATCGSASVTTLSRIAVSVSFAPSRGAGRKWAVQGVKGYYDVGARAGAARSPRSTLTKGLN